MIAHKFKVLGKNQIREEGYIKQKIR